MVQTNHQEPRSAKESWSHPLPAGTDFYAMLRAGDTLFATGTRRFKERPYFKGYLWTHSAEDGSQKTETALDALPAYEGLVAAAGRIYLTLQDSRLLCLGTK